MTTQVLVHCPAGEMPVYYLDTPSPAPLVILLMDAIGIREELRALAREFHALGYRVALPNLFYRDGAPEDVDFSTDSGRERVMRLYGALTHAMVREDIGALLEELAGDQPVGLLGYCMGGANALVLAGSYPDAVRAAAAIHPGGIATDHEDSPHRWAPKARGELYIAIADEDPYATPEQVATLEQALQDAGARYQLELYEGAQHGFSFESLPTYNAEAEARYRAAVTALFKRCLA